MKEGGGASAMQNTEHIKFVLFDDTVGPVLSLIKFLASFVR